MPRSSYVDRRIFPAVSFCPFRQRTVEQFTLIYYLRNPFSQIFNLISLITKLFKTVHLEIVRKWQSNYCYGITSSWSEKDQSLAIVLEHHAHIYHDTYRRPFDALLAGVWCRVLRHFLYLVRDRMLLMERGVHLARFLFTIASFFFYSRDIIRLMRHTDDLPFIFHGRISRVHCPLGQVRLWVSLGICVSSVFIFFYIIRVNCSIIAHSYSFSLIFFFELLFDQPFPLFYVRFISVALLVLPCYLLSLKILFSDSSFFSIPTRLIASMYYLLK